MKLKQRSFLGFVLCTLSIGCSREPAIVVRFDPPDIAGRQDLARALDAALPQPGDAAAAAAAVDRPAGKVERDKSEPRHVGPPATSAKQVRCENDAACVIVADGCCGCANGGKQRAVGKSEAAALRAAQAAGCKDVMCTMMVSTDSTCGKRAACVEGSCAMRDARPDEVRKLGPR